MDEFMFFLDQCPTPYHFVEYSRKVLKNNGFIELNEKETFPNPLPDQAFIVRDERSIIAFSFGRKESIIGVCSHNDTPCFKLKYNYEQFINSKIINEKNEKEGKNMNPPILRLSMYGSGLWYTYLDRDLRVAGSVLIKDNENQKLSQQLVDSKRGIAIIPNPAIHIEGKMMLEPEYEPEDFNAIFGYQSSLKYDSFKSYIGSLLNIENEKQIIDWDLRFVDAQPASSMDGYIYSGRINDLSNCYAGLKAFISYSKEDRETLPTQIFAIFDNELANDCNRYGAGSDFLPTVLEAIYKKYHDLKGNSKSSYISTSLNIKNSSLLISCNNDDCMVTYKKLSDGINDVSMKKGPLLKTTTKSSFTSDIFAASIVKTAAGKLLNFNLQEKNSYNSSKAIEFPTFGPILSTKTGIRTVDVGCPVFSMRSIRETIYWNDLDSLTKLLVSLYSNVINVDNEQNVL